MLGWLELLGEATPYQLKRAVERSVGNFWTFQHAQIYSETERLAAAGLLREVREQGGRRRKRYSLTPKGRRALDGWRSEPTDEIPELRDPGLLKLFFGAERAELGRVQAAAHERKLAEYLEIRKGDTGDEPRGPWIALESGIEHERLMIRFWRRLADSGR